MVTLAALPLAPARAQEDVWAYPRPPALQRCPNHIKVVWTDTAGRETVLAETDEALRVLETSHPPTYYLPPSALRVPLSTSARHTYCEWKGTAAYHTLVPPGTDGAGPVRDRIWSYPRPSAGFEPLRDYLSFYAFGQSEVGSWACFVDGEQVRVQDGDFYGGWITSNISGKMKGGPGTWGW